MNFFITIYLILLFPAVFAQQNDAISFQDKYKMHITKTTEPVIIDGELNEKVWSDAETTSPFYKKFPDDIGRPKRNTEVKLTYDDKFLYIAFMAYDSGKLFSQTLKRDFGHDGNDGVAIVLDPSNQHTAGFFFVVSAYNAQSEDQLPINNQAPWSWDCKWFSSTKSYTDKWIAEIAIPFKSIRYTADKLLWGINFVRIDTKTNEYSTWTHVPQNFSSTNLGYTGSLIWSEPPPKAGSNMVFIPYAIANLTEDRQNNIPMKAAANTGFDGKVAISSSLNLDLTINPDFSQVEVDRQVTNLTRFNIFYPEKRSFFLENSDLFAQFGEEDVRPFYSRKIGLDANSNRIPIIAGIRLTGNIDKFTRIGVMDIQTGNKDAYSAENYLAATVHRNILKRSIAKVYFLNRENFISQNEKKLNPLNAYGRNAGAEFNYSNVKGTWNGLVSFNQSYKPGIENNNNFVKASVSYNGRYWNASTSFSRIGAHYYTDMGFVQRIENYDPVRDTLIRLGYKQFSNFLSYSLYPGKTNIHTHRFQVFNELILNPDNSFNESVTGLQYNAQLRNTGVFVIGVNHNKTDLLFPVAFTDGVPLPAAVYDFTQAVLVYQSDFRKKFSYAAQIRAGGFYNGTSKSVSITSNFRQQPYVNISLRLEYNKLQFPDVHGSTELFLIAPKFEFNFSTKLFWTTFIQYNTQRNNFNINSRFQYRFKPMSDIFLVYTDNYFTDPFFKNKNRALVFKMNYWLNL